MLTFRGLAHPIDNFTPAPKRVSNCNSMHSINPKRQTHRPNRKVGGK